MAKLEYFKRLLARVFDNNLRTKQWENYVDYAIIGMIIISTISVFISTFNISPQLERILHIVDIITVVFFTIEVTLRIWAADESNPKFRGFWGRVRYCFTFYGMIDILSTYTFYLSLFLPLPYTILKSLRVLRLLRVFRYMRSFRLLQKAIQSKAKEMLISLQFLVIVTLMLSFVLFFYEHAAQPEVYDNGIRSVLWAFTQYIGDPGGFADTPPITFAGRFIACIIGILGIALFAVPAGLIGAGFSEAMEEEKRKQELEKFYHRILKAFRRSSNKTLRAYLNSLPDGGGEALSKLNFVPQSIPVAQLQLRQGMDLKDIFETCNEFPGLRLNNLATAKSDEDNAIDTFVVEHFPINRTYGCCINRGSNVTIVSPSGVTEIGVSWYAYYLAKFGGFNLISKDIEIDSDEIDSFYNMSPKPLYDKKTREEYTSKDKEIIAIIDRKEQCRKDFLQDLKDMNSGKNSWVIIVTPHQKDSTNQTDFHFVYTTKDGANPTLSNEEKYSEFYQEFSSLMDNEFKLSSENKSSRYPLLKNNLAYRMSENGIDSNAFVLRLSTDLINFESCRLVIALQMAQVISSQFDNSRGVNPDDIKDLASIGFGYAENK